MPIHDWTRVIAGIFHHFHQRWIGEISDALNNGVLPKGYYALAEQFAEGPQPDVLALETHDEDFASSGSSVALATEVLLRTEHPPQVRYTEEAEYARTADRVAIYHASGDRVVAYIEIVSQGNKHTEFELKRFLDKLDEALQRGCHLLVVDLYPPGRHDPQGMHAAFWRRRATEPRGVTADEPLGLSAYRSDLHPTAYFEPTAVGRPLPPMPLFLTPDHYITVPLETTYQAAYRSVPQRWKTVIEGLKT